MGQHNKQIQFPPMPSVQILGTPEQIAAWFEWLAERDRVLIEQTVVKYDSRINDPLAGHPETAPAKYWAALKGKSNGGRCSAQAFTKWARENGLCREKNGAWSKEAARKFLFG